jgi:DNA-binding SARP family transcriptional activator
MPSALRFAQEAIGATPDQRVQRLATATLLLHATGATGSMRTLLDVLYELANDQRAVGARHHLGITELNIAILETWMERPDIAAVHADISRELLGESARDVEAASAELVKATCLAQLGRMADADRTIVQAVDGRQRIVQVEALGEGARMCLWYGSSDRARDFMSELTQINDHDYYASMVLANHIWISLESGDRADLPDLMKSLGSLPLNAAYDGEVFNVQLAMARAAISLGLPEASDWIQRLRATAVSQDSVLQRNVARLLEACVRGPAATERALRETSDSLASTVLATDVLSHIDEISNDAFAVVLVHAARHRMKWLGALRRRIERRESPSTRSVAIIEQLGTADDAGLLRALGRRHRRNAPVLAASRRLAQRTARRLVIEDLGRIGLNLDGLPLASLSVRRKVLAVLAFLVTQPQMTATRDQVLEAIWPDVDPETALNSLNQTIYFLRRVIDPHYQAAVSPEYVHFEGEAVWLDAELVSSVSDRCRKLMARTQGGELSDVYDLLNLYTGRFALDFAYEEWATAYRESLHATFLLVVERASSQLEAAGRLEEAAAVARRCLDVDPTADQVELRLLRLYRRLGAHAAAAEQYGHYASVLRDELGVDPPDLEDI